MAVAVCALLFAAETPPASGAETASAGFVITGKSVKAAAGYKLKMPADKKGSVEVIHAATGLTAVKVKCDCSDDICGWKADSADAIACVGGACCAISTVPQVVFTPAVSTAEFTFSGGVITPVAGYALRAVEGTKALLEVTKATGGLSIKRVACTCEGAGSCSFTFGDGGTAECKGSPCCETFISTTVVSQPGTVETP